MSKRKPRSSIQLDPEDKEKIDSISERSGMPRGVVIGYLAEECLKYKMFESNWVEKLCNKRMKELEKEHDFGMRKEVELIKLKSATRIREVMIRDYYRGLEVPKRTQYLEKILGDPDRAGDIIDRITSQQIFLINGQNRMCEPNPDGLPRLVGIPPSQIVRCPKGFHTHLDDCRACLDRLSCETRKTIITDWIAVHGTSKEQEEFLIHGNFDVSKRSVLKV